ncbi:hypothetical protein [Rhizobium sp. SGZ-381]|uniref:hypothetical protein n=1 Tax=Rhizobium sp. SGZ-381 TaxID=3342800 RepID=UPI00366FCA84
MTISFPREIPDVGYTTADFTLSDPVKASQSGARLINYTQISDPAWVASLVTRPLVASQYAEVEAWWLSLRGGLQRVLFRHPWFCYPKNHVANHGPADDAGNLVSIASGNVLSVNSVDSALSLVVGDRIGLERSGRYYVGRLTEISGSGTSRSLTVEPLPFDTVSAAGAVVRFARPALVMRPVPESFSISRSGRHTIVSFSLVEGQ